MTDNSLENTELGILLLNELAKKKCGKRGSLMGPVEGMVSRKGDLIYTGNPEEDDKIMWFTHGEWREAKALISGN